MVFQTASSSLLRPHNLKLIAQVSRYQITHALMNFQFEVQSPKKCWTTTCDGSYRNIAYYSDDTNLANELQMIHHASAKKKLVAPTQREHIHPLQTGSMTSSTQVTYVLCGSFSAAQAESMQADRHDICVQHIQPESVQWAHLRLSTSHCSHWVVTWRNWGRKKDDSHYACHNV